MSATRSSERSSGWRSRSGGRPALAIDFSGLMFPKQRPKALDKADKAKALEALDKKESAKAKKRAGGRCEVKDVGRGPIQHGVVMFCCPNKDTETHHLLGGIGRRNKGQSILAEYKLRVCNRCHLDITANILRPTTATHDAATVRFWRAR
jgi:hypothetical protein